MLVVTTNDIRGWELQRVCGEVFGLSLRAGTAPGSEGERSLTESRNEAISRMLEHARQKGGNAVVGLRFDSSEIGDAVTELCAYGTAVVAIPVDDGARQTAMSLGYGQPGGTPAANPEAAQTQHDPSQYAQPGYQQQYPQQPGYPGYGQQTQPSYPGQQQYPQQGPGYQQYPPQGYPQQ